MRDFLLKLKAGTEHLNYGRDILANYALEIATNKTELKILDIGLGTGKDLMNIRQKCLEMNPLIKMDLSGLECYPPNVESARKQGIQVFPVNIESDAFPFDDNVFDIVISNQTLEHTKELYWIFSEISRVLKPEGFVLSGVPNLASFHNRVALLFGLQPTSIELLGPHVRGFTAPGFIKFVETDGFFVNRAVKGSNFYPFPPAISSFFEPPVPVLKRRHFFQNPKNVQTRRVYSSFERSFFRNSIFCRPEVNLCRLRPAHSFIWPGIHKSN